LAGFSHADTTSTDEKIGWGGSEQREWQENLRLIEEGQGEELFWLQGTHEIHQD